MMANITEGKLNAAQQAIEAMAADIASRGDARVTGVRVTADNTWIVDFFVWPTGAMSMRGNSLAEAWLKLAHRLEGTDPPPFK